MEYTATVFYPTIARYITRAETIKGFWKRLIALGDFMPTEQNRLIGNLTKIVTDFERKHGREASVHLEKDSNKAGYAYLDKATISSALIDCEICMEDIISRLAGGESICASPPSVMIKIDFRSKDPQHANEYRDLGQLIKSFNPVGAAG